MLLKYDRQIMKDWNNSKNKKESDMSKGVVDRMSEWREVQALFTGQNDPEQICRKRTEYALNWYIRRAIKNKYMYYVFSCIGIICPLVCNILVICIEDKMVTVILSSITSFAASMLALTNARAKWENYRSAAEMLKREYTLFLSETGIYSGKKRVSRYLHNIEGYMQETHGNWQKNFNVDEGKEERNDYRSEQTSKK